MYCMTWTLNLTLALAPNKATCHYRPASMPSSIPPTHTVTGQVTKVKEKYLISIINHVHKAAGALSVTLVMTSSSS